MYIILSYIYIYIIVTSHKLKTSKDYPKTTLACFGCSGMNQKNQGKQLLTALL